MQTASRNVNDAATVGKSPSSKTETRDYHCDWAIPLFGLYKMLLKVGSQTDTCSPRERGREKLFGSDTFCNTNKL